MKFKVSAAWNSDNDNDNDILNCKYYRFWSECKFQFQYHGNEVREPLNHSLLYWRRVRALENKRYLYL